MRLITCAFTSLAVALVSCAPQRIAERQTPAAASPIVSPSPATSPAATAPVVQPSISPSPVAAPEVKIVEPPFRPPQQWTYSPDEVSVKVGTKVVWTNTGAVAHTATADDGTSFDSGSIDPKASFALTPTAAGTFAYHCTFHPWMKGTLVVVTS